MISEWDRKGLFMGPSESSEMFEKRAIRLLSGLEGPRSLALERVNQLFGALPSWIQVEPKAKGLLPWEAAATWIWEDEEGNASYQIHLNPRTWYSKEEVAAHEMVHVMRLCFDEEVFEEVLAYQTSKRWFRRYFGPLFSNPKETKLFLFLLFIPWLCFICEMLFSFPFYSAQIALIPLAVLCFGIFRLIWKQRIFGKCIANLGLCSPGRALGIALRLSDAEIRLFSKSSPDEIIQYARDEGEKGVRWQHLYSTYF